MTSGVAKLFRTGRRDRDARHPLHAGRNGRVDRLSRIGRQVRTLADGDGDTPVTCLHFVPGATIRAPPVTHDSALLIVSGNVNVVLDAGGSTFLSAGMGVVIDAGQHYSLNSSTGAIAIAVESR